MNKTRTQLLQELQKLVVMGNHPLLSYEEALQKECKKYWCIYDYSNCKFIIFDETTECYMFYDSLYEEIVRINFYNSDKSPLWLPITLWRVLSSLNNSKKWNYIVTDDGTMYDLLSNKNMDTLCYWELTKETWEECTAEDQDTETIEALIDILKN